MFLDIHNLTLFGDSYVVLKFKLNDSIFSLGIASGHKQKS